jgi:hypothetical protein
MQDKTYGWTVEMQLKVLKQNMSYVEIPFVTKTESEYLKCLEPLGSVMAGIKIIG